MLMWHQNGSYVTKSQTSVAVGFVSEKQKHSSDDYNKYIQVLNIGGYFHQENISLFDVHVSLQG